jgi:O-acetylhomoserine (thiol)-lyase
MAHRPETLAVHAGQEQADPTTNARAVPIYQTVGYVVRRRPARRGPLRPRRPGQHLHADHEPDVVVLEQRVTALEGAVAALRHGVRASAAVTYAVLNIARSRRQHRRPLDPVRRHLQRCSPTRCRSTASTVRFVDPDAPRRPGPARRRPHTKLVFAETVGNPRVNVVDIDAWSGAAHDGSACR